MWLWRGDCNQYTMKMPVEMVSVGPAKSMQPSEDEYRRLEGVEHIAKCKRVGR